MNDPRPASGLSRIGRRLLQPAVALGMSALATLPGLVRAQRALENSARVAVVDTIPARPALPDTLASPAAGRAPWLVAPGDTVRFFTGRSELVRGVLVQCDSAGASVLPFLASSVLYLHRADFDVAEVRRGQRRRGGDVVRRGANIGTAVGAVVFGLVIAGSETHGGWDYLLAYYAFLSSSVIGAGVGGILAFTHTDRWVRFDVASRRVLSEIEPADRE